MEYSPRTTVRYEQLSAIAAQQRLNRKMENFQQYLASLRRGTEIFYFDNQQAKQIAADYIVRNYYSDIYGRGPSRINNIGKHIPLNEVETREYTGAPEVDVDFIVSRYRNTETSEDVTEHGPNFNLDVLRFDTARDIKSYYIDQFFTFVINHANRRNLEEPLNMRNLVSVNRYFLNLDFDEKAIIVRDYLSDGEGGLITKARILDGYGGILTVDNHAAVDDFVELLTQVGNNLANIAAVPANNTVYEKFAEAVTKHFRYRPGNTTSITGNFPKWNNSFLTLIMSMTPEQVDEMLTSLRDVDSVQRLFGDWRDKLTKLQNGEIEGLIGYVFSYGIDGSQAMGESKLFLRQYTTEAAQLLREEIREEPSSSGPHTNMVVTTGRGRDTRKRVYGNGHYVLPDFGYYDNSFSGNLCGITCILDNPKISIAREAKNISREEILSQVLLESNLIYRSGGKLYIGMCNVENIQEVMVIINRILGKSFELRLLTLNSANENKDPSTMVGKKTLTTNKKRTETVEINGKKTKRTVSVNSRYVKSNEPNYIKVLLDKRHAYTVCNDDHLTKLAWQLSYEKLELISSKAINDNITATVEALNLAMINSGNIVKKALEHYKHTNYNYSTYVSAGDLDIFDEMYEERRANLQANRANGTPKLSEEYFFNKYINAEWSEPDYYKATFTNYTELKKWEEVIRKEVYKKNTIVISFDIETFAHNGRHTIYLLCAKSHNDGSEIVLRSKWKDRGVMDERAIVLGFMEWIRDMRDPIKPWKTINVKLFAHNGGGFDFPIVMNVMGELHLNNYARCSLISDIHGGGKFKFVSAEYGRSDEDLEDLYELEHIDRGYSILERLTANEADVDCDSGYVDCRISMVDSWCLIGGSIEKMHEDWELGSDYEKGAFPHRFCQYLITSNKYSMPMSEIMTLNKEDILHANRDAIYDELIKYRKSKTTYEPTETLWEDAVTYCKQDVNVMCAALEKAKTVYHEIDMSDMVDPTKTIRGFNLNANDMIYDTVKKKFKSINFLSSVTKTGYIKKIVHFMFSRANTSTKGALYEYCNNWSGGIVNCRGVYYNPLDRRIATNKYLNITDPKVAAICAELYGYDPNSPKETYRNEEGAEVLESYINNTTLLAAYDAASLYPSAGYKLAKIGGMPKGEFTKFSTNEEFERIINNNLRAIFEVEVTFTEKGLSVYREIEERKAEGSALITQYYATGATNEQLFNEGWELLNTPKPWHQLVTKPEKEGNRFLEPSDENKIIMTDMMYRSYVDHGCDGLFTLQVLGGVYWEESTPVLGNFFQTFYENRLIEKANKMKVKAGNIKEIICGTYGIMLEGLHPTKTVYTSTRHRMTINPNTGNPEVCEASSLDVVKDRNRVSSVCKFGDRTVRVEVINNAAINSFNSMNHWGFLILDASKYIMYDLVSKLGWQEIKYFDTDCAVSDVRNYRRVIDSNPELFGDYLCQFKNDFTDKVGDTLAKIEKDWKPEDKTKWQPINKKDGVVAVSSVMLGKKLYSHLLMYERIDKEGNKSWDIMSVATAKGQVASAFSYDQFVKLVDPRNVVQQNRAEIRPAFVKTDKGLGGIAITSPDDNVIFNLMRSMANRESKAVSNIAAKAGIKPQKKRGPNAKFIYKK